MSQVQLERINLNLLLVLDRLLQTGSVTEAAQELAVTPSAVSHNLRTLRELFDDPLLVRGQGGLLPTPRADALRAPLQLALRQVQEALHAAPFEPDTARRRFPIACTDFLGHLWIGRIQREIAADWPGIDFDVLPSARAENAWRLETGELAVAVGGLVPEMPGTRRTLLYTERLVVVVRRDHPHVGPTIDLDAYCALPHALVGLEDTYDPDDTRVDQVLAAQGLRRRVALRQRSFFGTLQTILESDLITTLPRTMAAWAQARFGVRVLPPPLDLGTYPEEMMWHQRFDDDPAHAWLRARIVTAARETRTELLGPDPG